MLHQIKQRLRTVKRYLFNQPFSSSNYWEKRYAQGENSGDGSYGQLAQFKAEIINPFVREHGIQSAIEYGCGDGNQLQLLDLPQYLGFDVSATVIQLCQQKYAHDPSKRFKVIADYQGETAELTLSLDVLYHLVEEAVYTAYLQRLFASAQSYVIVYSSNFDDSIPQRAPHVKHRRFTAWVDQHYPQWQLVRHVANPYADVSSAEFFLYAKG